MKTRALGTTGVELSVLGIGTWAIGGGDWKYGWGSQQDNESIAAIHAALDLGFNWIDTAAVYGLGHSEEIVGRALKEGSHSPFIATKCGLKQDKKGEVYSEISAKSIRIEVEASLRRLGVERIDLYQIHWPNPKKDIEEAFQTLLKLKEEGKIRFAGVSNFSLDQLQKISELEFPTSLQSPLSLVRPELTYEVLPWCEKNNVGVLAYSPMQAGLLTGKASKEWVKSLDDRDWRKSNKHFIEPSLSEILDKIKKTEDIIKKTNAEISNPIMAAALQWVLAQRAVTSAIVGVRNAKQAEGIVSAIQKPFDRSILSEIEHLYI